MPAKSKKSAKQQKKTAGKASAKALPDFYLIDASIYIFRAYFSMPSSIQDSAGRPVGAVYGFTDFLIKLITEARPTHLLACFDESLNSSYRNEIYPEYKANRELPPADLERQLKLCREIAGLMGMPAIAHDRYEADDLIGACMQKHRARFKSGVIVSSDKDLAQLLNQHDVLWDYARERRFDPPAIVEHFGVPPERIADYLALAGDAVDNIPGVSGIGAKTAATLVREFGGVSTILKSIPKIADSSGIRGAAKIAATLEREADDLRRWLAVTRIETRISGLPGWRELGYRGPDLNALTALFEAEGFGTRLPQRVAKFAAAIST